MTRATNACGSGDVSLSEGAAMVLARDRRASLVANLVSSGTQEIPKTKPSSSAHHHLGITSAASASVVAALARSINVLVYM